MTTKFDLGDWSFSPSAATLIHANGKQRRLENRASDVLTLLCESAGGVVSHAELVEKVWGGRELSRNSVAVVIGDLRRALDDDARSPRYIETIPKRGYRLLALGAATHPLEAAPAGAATWFTRSRALALCAALIAMLGVGLLTRQMAAAHALTSIAVSAFPNETSMSRYDSLSVSVTQIINAELARQHGVEVIASGGEPEIRVRGTVAMWEGEPAVYIFAEDSRDGTVVWSGVAPGPEAALPGQLHEQIGKFVDDLQQDDDAR